MKNFLLLTVLMLLCFGCLTSENESEDGRIHAIASILPQKEFVKAVGGDYVDVTALIPPGASPATYEPSPQELALVERADVYFKIGYIPFEESHAVGFSSLNPNMVVVDTSEGITTRHFGDEGENEHVGVDPHTWLSPRLVVIQVETIYRTLAEMDPEHKAYYRHNADEYILKLNALDGELANSLTGLRTKKLMVFHPAWGYFADEYGLEQVAVEQEGKEPTAEDLRRLIDGAKAEDVKVIFIQKQFSAGIAQSVADEIGGIVVSIDPLSENYLENMESVGKTISENLKGRTNEKN